MFLSGIEIKFRHFEFLKNIVPASIAKPERSQLFEQPNMARKTLFAQRCLLGARQVHTIKKEGH